jgi:hypothetical protein
LDNIYFGQKYLAQTEKKVLKAFDYFRKIIIIFRKYGQLFRVLYGSLESKKNVQKM